MKHIIAICLSLFCLSASAASLAQQADSAYNREAYADAIRLYQESIFHNGLYWLTFIIAVAILIAIAIIYRRQLKFNADVKGRKHARANRVVSKRLKSAREFMKAHENEKFYAELAKAMWGYISDKLSIAPSQLIRDNIASQLENYGASEQTAKDVLSVLDECEMARFTPQHSDQEVAQLYDQAVAAIKSLEDVKK